MDTSTPALWEKMRALAASGHDRAEELTKQADELEQKTSGYYADPPTVEVKSFVGAWARAKRTWSECTGEPLL